MEDLFLLLCFITFFCFAIYISLEISDFIEKAKAKKKLKKTIKDRVYKAQFLTNLNECYKDTVADLDYFD